MIIFSLDGVLADALGAAEHDGGVALLFGVLQHVCAVVEEELVGGTNIVVVELEELEDELDDEELVDVLVEVLLEVVLVVEVVVEDVLVEVEVEVVEVEVEVVVTAAASRIKTPEASSS